MSKDKKRASSSVFQEAEADAYVNAGGQTQQVEKWHAAEASKKILESQPNQPLLEKITKLGERLYQEAVEKFKESLGMSKSDLEWFQQVTAKGTLNDKIAAYAMAVQDGPFYSLGHLNALLVLASSSNRHEILPAAEALKDALVANALLPSDRKLYYLHQRPLSMKLSDNLNSDIMIWYFEDRLKAVYFSFLKIIEQLLADNVVYTRERATRFLFDLMFAAPQEQQTNSLPLLCNKLGDPEKKLSSRIIFYLEELLKQHPVLTANVISSVKEVVTRPKIPERAQYYGLVFFSQMVLSRKHPEIAVQLLSVYVIFFKSTVAPLVTAMNSKKNKSNKKQKDVETEPPRVAKAVLMGINRALPFTEGTATAKEAVKDFFQPLQKLCKMSNIHTALLSLSLYSQLCSVLGDDAFQRNLFYSLLTTLVGEWVRLGRFSNSYVTLFGLLEKVIANTKKVDVKVEKLIKRVLNTALHLNGHFTLLALKWLEQTLNAFPALKAMIQLPPDAPGDVREYCLYEVVALCDHYDPVISDCAKKILKGEKVAWVDDLSVASDPRTFMASLTALNSLNGLSGKYSEWFSEMKKFSRTSVSKKDQPGLTKPKVKDGDSVADEEEDVDDDLFSDDVSDNLEPFSDIDDAFEDENDGISGSDLEFEQEGDSDIVFESADESEMEME